MALIFALLVAANLLNSKYNYYLHINAEIQNPYLANRSRICMYCICIFVARNNYKTETRNRFKGNRFRQPIRPGGPVRQPYTGWWNRFIVIDPWAPETYTNSGSVHYVRSFRSALDCCYWRVEDWYMNRVRNFSFDLELLDELKAITYKPLNTVLNCIQLQPNTTTR
jgi:hypothetical protein